MSQGWNFVSIEKSWGIPLLSCIILSVSNWVFLISIFWQPRHHLTCTWFSLTVVLFPHLFFNFYFFILGVEKNILGKCNFGTAWVMEICVGELLRNNYVTYLCRKYVWIKNIKLVFFCWRFLFNESCLVHGVTSHIEGLYVTTVRQWLDNVSWYWDNGVLIEMVFV